MFGAGSPAIPASTDALVSGYRLNDPAADLGVCLAILSSYFKKPLPRDLVAVGEIGLSAEIRTPKELAKLKKEIEKLGLKLNEYTNNLETLVNKYFK